MQTESKWERRAAAAAVVLSLSIASQAVAQPVDFASPTFGRFYAFGGLGVLIPQGNPQLHGENAGLSGLAGGGFRFSPLLSLEVGLLATGQSIDSPAAAAPAAGTFKDGTLKTQIGTGGLNVGVKFHFPLDRFEPYVGAGVGAYTTNFRMTSEATSCQQHCSDTGPRVTARSHDVGYHALVGLDFHLRPKDVLVAEFRYLRVKANFDNINLGNVNAGGSLLWMGYRRYF
ncbi:MAG TPA: outer membrane beta-barrel protein [Burkholderiales bacterium]|nr:outer membrane beta-barrel protein [Burkholderiales bacterium]